MTQHEQVLSRSSDMQQHCHLKSYASTEQWRWNAHKMVCECVRAVNYYQCFQPVMDICLELRVIEDSSCETKEDTDGIFQWLNGTRLSLACWTIWWEKKHTHEKENKTQGHSHCLHTPSLTITAARLRVCFNVQCMTKSSYSVTWIYNTIHNVLCTMLWITV